MGVAYVSATGSAVVTAVVLKGYLAKVSPPTSNLLYLSRNIRWASEAQTRFQEERVKIFAKTLDIHTRT